jgi:2-polyprenyl-3-methyl-5-hydroxy-6-metoxy-1,4-benzoquinol methylase
MDESLDQHRNPKATSYAYGEIYQRQMVEYYKQSKIASDGNHEYLRVVLARNLINNWALPRLSHKQKQETVIVDIGCSVGLFAIEFAKQGYKSS